MTIRLEFDSYNEMYTFCADIIGSRKPAKEKPVIVQEPEAKQEEPTVEKEETPIQEEEHTYSKTEVRAYLAKLQKEGKKKEVTELINSLGFDKFSEVPEDKYSELMKKAGEL